MWFGDEDEASRLEAQGHRQIEAGDLGAAQRTADALLAMRWSGGFAIEALALASAGDLEAAVAGLEAGVARAPDAWALWQLLGNLRSDLGRLDDAIAAFDRALRCEGASQIAIGFNRAVVHHRADRFGEALADLEPILSLPRPPPELAERALALTLECLAAIGRAADAVDMIEAALATCADDDPRRPGLHAQHALALDRADDDAIARAFTAAAEAGAIPPALAALGRRRFPDESKGPHHRYSVVVQGAAPPDVEAEGFLRVFDVVAASPEHALALVQRHSPGSLTLERHETIEPDTDLEPGIHGASAPMLFA